MPSRKSLKAYTRMIRGFGNNRNQLKLTAFAGRRQLIMTNGVWLFGHTKLLLLNFPEFQYLMVDVRACARNSALCGRLLR